MAGRDLSVAVLGATGAVGVELLRLLEQRRFPVGELRCFASPRSAGRHVCFRDRAVRVTEPSPEAFSGVDVAFFSAGATRSREWAPVANANGARVIDNSSAYRMDPDVPLVIPEINGDACKGARIVANPNCTAAILLMALHPLGKLGRLERVIVSTYQSASGGGAALMQELLDATSARLAGITHAPEVCPHPYAFNLFSHTSPVGPDGRNEEEVKVADETRKILGMPNLGLTVTCVRVPVLRAHTVSVVAEFAGEAPEPDAFRDELRASPGVQLVDEPAANHFPMPSEATGRDEVLVGRIRRDPGSPRGICFMACGDQLLKGAALNAVQIGERLLAFDEL